MYLGVPFNILRHPGYVMHPSVLIFASHSSLAIFFVPFSFLFAPCSLLISILDLVNRWNKLASCSAVLFTKSAKTEKLIRDLWVASSQQILVHESLAIFPFYSTTNPKSKASRFTCKKLFKTCNVRLCNCALLFAGKCVAPRAPAQTFHKRSLSVKTTFIGVSTSCFWFPALEIFPPFMATQRQAQGVTRGGGGRGG